MAQPTMLTPSPAAQTRLGGELPADLDTWGRRARTLYEQSPLICLLLDPQGHVLDCNRRAALALGRSTTALRGVPLGELVPPEERALLEAHLGGLARPDRSDEAPLAFELVLLAPPGPLPTSCTLSAVRGADGAPVEVHAQLIDLSDIRGLQQRMMAADRLASVGQLAAGVAHEINNPAAFVIANLNYLEDKVPLLQRCFLRPSPQLTREVHTFLEELPQLCEQTLTGMRRIRDIVRDLKLFTRRGESEEQPESFDLNALCDTVANMAWLEIRRHGRLEKNYGDLPALCGHPGRISQVLMNLIINAAQAIPEGKQSKNKITLTTATEGDWATVAVRDTGRGIPAAVRGRIFDPFFTTKPPGEGTGLGLSLSAEIVRCHGGRIEVQSAAGAGTTFTVWLPLPRERTAPPRPASSPPGLAAGSRPASGPPGTMTTAAGSRPASRPVVPGAAPTRAGKVLVVDDEPELLRAVARTLREEHVVLLAGSGEEGRALLLANKDIDVVLCDVMMPETSGMDLYESLPRALRERFIFVSGDTASQAARAFLDSVRRPHLDKPVEADALRQAVRDAIASRPRA